MRHILPTKPVLVASMIVVAIGGWQVHLSPLRAQDDPFAGDPFGAAEVDPADPFGSAPPSNAATPNVFGNAPPEAPATTGEPPAADDPDPVVRLLRATPPKTTRQWADALIWMARIQRWDEVRRLLDNLAGESWDVERQAELARTAGPSLWLRLRVDEADLSPEQLQVVRDIQAAPAKLARDVATIDGWIEELASPEAGQRRLAQLRLHDGSMVAVQRLVDRLLSGDGPVAPAMLAGTIADFGADGEDALRAACLVSDPQRAARVYLALAELPNKTFATELGSALASRWLPEDAQQALSARLLERHGKVPAPDAIHAFLTRRFDEALAYYQHKRMAASDFSALVWRPTPDGQTIHLVEAPASQRALERLGQLAAHRMLLEVATHDDFVDSGTVLLQRAYQLSPQIGLGEIGPHMLVAIDSTKSSDGQYWQQVFELADEQQMHGAAVRALQLLSEHALQGDFSPPLDFLSELLNDPRPMIRYAALQSIARLDPKEPFAGAEAAIDTAIEMASLSGGPQALVIGLHSELRQAAGHLLQQQNGAEVVTVNSGRAALLALSGSEPIELIVVVDRVADLSVFELLQRLRNTQNGQSLPIAVLTDQLYPHERRQIDKMPGVTKGVLTQDPDQMQRVISTMLQTLDTQPMSASDRGEFAVAAGTFLARVSENREQYAFYPISSWRNHLVNLRGGLSIAGRINLMSALGAASGQEGLAEIAADSGVDEASRIAAARAFGKSVRRFGMLMSRASLLQTYDLYNHLGPNDPVAATALGLILDIAEAHAGQKEWPEGL